MATGGAITRLQPGSQGDIIQYDSASAIHCKEMVIKSAENSKVLLSDLLVFLAGSMSRCNMHGLSRRHGVPGASGSNGHSVSLSLSSDATLVTLRPRRGEDLSSLAISVRT